MNTETQDCGREVSGLLEAPGDGWRVGEAFRIRTRSTGLQGGPRGTTFPMKLWEQRDREFCREGHTCQKPGPVPRGWRFSKVGCRLGCRGTWGWVASRGPFPT